MMHTGDGENYKTWKQNKMQKELIRYKVVLHDRQMRQRVAFTNTGDG
jgi:hypothetical protein